MAVLVVVVPLVYVHDFVAVPLVHPLPPVSSLHVAFIVPLVLHDVDSPLHVHVGGVLSTYTCAVLLHVVLFPTASFITYDKAAVFVVVVPLVYAHDFVVAVVSQLLPVPLLHVTFIVPVCLHDVDSPDQSHVGAVLSTYTFAVLLHSVLFPAVSFIVYDKASVNVVVSPLVYAHDFVAAVVKAAK